MLRPAHARRQGPAAARASRSARRGSRSSCKTRLRASATATTCAATGARSSAKCCSLGLEGVVSKRADKPYVSERGTSWLKIEVPGPRGVRDHRLSTLGQEGPRVRSLLLGEYEATSCATAGVSARLRRSHHRRHRGAAETADARVLASVREVPREIRRAARLGGAAARRGDRLHRAHERRRAAPSELSRLARGQARERSSRATGAGERGRTRGPAEPARRSAGRSG